MSNNLLPAVTTRLLMLFFTLLFGAKKKIQRIPKPELNSFSWEKKNVNNDVYKKMKILCWKIMLIHYYIVLLLSSCFLIKPNSFKYNIATVSFNGKFSVDD